MYFCPTFCRFLRVESLVLTSAMLIRHSGSTVEKLRRTGSGVFSVGRSDVRRRFGHLFLTQSKVERQIVVEFEFRSLVSLDNKHFCVIVSLDSQLSLIHLRRQGAKKCRYSVIKPPKSQFNCFGHHLSNQHTVRTRHLHRFLMETRTL